MDNSKNLYRYVFSNGESYTMTPVEAHKYKYKKMIDIVSGPNYQSGKQQRTFDGWGYHDSLKRVFKGPNDYRSYLRENNLIEVGNEGPVIQKDYDPPIWNEDLLRKAASYGIEIGSVMAEALLSGELDYPEGA